MYKIFYNNVYIVFTHLSKMRKNGQAAVQALLVVVCILLILLLIVVLISPFIFSGVSGKTVSNSRNTQCVTTQVPYTTQEIVCENRYDNYYRYGDLDYRVDYSGYEKQYKDSGAYKNRYAVRVRNVDYQGGYFTVRFYLYDDGDRVTKTVRKYIDDGEAVTFYYPDYGYSDDWDYQVISESRGSRYDYRYDSRHRNDYCYPKTVVKYRSETKCS